MALNNPQNNEIRRINTFKLLLTDKDNKKIAQGYTPFQEVADTFLIGYDDLGKIIPLKDYGYSHSITEDKKALRLNIADTFQPYIDPLKHYATKAGKTDLLKSMHATYSDIKSNMLETEIYPYFENIFEPLTVLITDKDPLFLKYKIEQKHLDGILSKAKSFNDMIGKAEVVALPAIQANEDINAKIKVLGGNINEMVDLGIHFKADFPEFYNAIKKLKKVEKLGTRSNKASFEVKDAATNEILPNAKIKSLSNNKTTKGDSKTIEGIMQGDRQFLVTCDGYQDKTVTAKVIRGKEIVVSVLLDKK